MNEFEPPRRSRGATQVLSILSMVFGSLGVFQFLFGMMAIALFPVFKSWAATHAPALATFLNQPTFDALTHPARILVLVLGGIVACSLTVGGWRAYKLTPGSRRFLLGVAVGQVVVAVLNLAIQLAIDLPAAQATSAATRTGAPTGFATLELAGNLFTYGFAFLISMILPGCLLYFLTRPDAIEQFEGQGISEEIPDLPAAH